jgi:CheY-like chemotaxis protein
MKSRIMVVDDERDFLDSVRRGLIMSGYNDLTLTPDPLHAAALLESGECFDVALLDITMPRMDGMELLRKSRPSVPLRNASW